MRWWKWVGLGALTAVAVAGTTVVVSRQRREWVDADDADLSARLRSRLLELRTELADVPSADTRPGVTPPAAADAT